MLFIQCNCFFSSIRDFPQNQSQNSTSPTTRKMGAEEEIREANQRSTPNPSPNPLTEAQFLSWKRQKDDDASARKAEAARKREEDIAAGIVQMNGRELFLHEPSVFDNSLY